MGLFGKLFSKKAKEETEYKKNDRISFDSPFCSFVYIAEAAEQGYEGEIDDWYTDGRDFEKNICVYFYADTPECPEFSSGYKELVKLISDRERTDHEIKKIVVDHFLFKTDFIKEGTTEEELMTGIRIIGIYVYKT